MQRFKVLFGSAGNFGSAKQNTAFELREHKDIIIEECSDDEIGSLIADADVVIPFMSKLTDSIIQKATKLKMIMQFGVGLEGVDIQAATKYRIPVCPISSMDCGNAKSCAEHAIYLALSVLRDQSEMNRSLNRGVIGYPTGRTLFNSNILIYGYGSIGQQLAKRLSVFEANVSAVNRTVYNENNVTNNDEIMKNSPTTSVNQSSKDFLNIDCLTELSPLDAYPRLAADTDILFVCCSQNSSNMGFVNKSFISHLKDGAIIINIARVSAY